MFDRYIALYGKRLYGLCVNLCGVAFDPDDLYQETWLKALGKIHRYDESKPFEPWITAICVNIYRDMLRKHKNNLFPDVFKTFEEKDRFLNSVAEASRDGDEDRESVLSAVDRLPPKLRTTVILFYFNDLSEKQTAEALNIPQGTVKSRLNKAKKLLREELKHEFAF